MIALDIGSLFYRFSDKEIKQLLGSIVILVDSREQENSHIIQFFESKKISYKVRKLVVGDYGGMIPANKELGIVRDLYIPAVIERKNSLDELIGNFKAKKRTAFQNELIRSKDTDFVLLIEQKNGYEDILNNNYRSQMNPASVIGTLISFECRYRFNTIFVDKKISPIWIYYHIYYGARYLLKG